MEGGWSGGGLTVFGVRRLPSCPYSSARPSSWQQVGVRRARVYVRRTPVALDAFFVVHTEVRRLCADVRPHLGRPRLHVLVDSASECDRAGNTVAKRTSTLCHGSSSVSHAYRVLTLLTRGRLRPLFPSAQLPPGTHPLPLSFRSYVSLSLYLLLVK